MRKNTYNVTGMTCEGCVYSVKHHLEKHENVVEASVSLLNGTVDISSERDVDLFELQQLLDGSHYELNEVSMPYEVALPSKSIRTYFPLLLIVGFIAGVSLLAQIQNGGTLSFDLWMRHFMAGFFIVFSFFKLLNVKGFANSYRMYDVVAKAIPAWGYIYPFVELMLGIGYLINRNLILINWLTVVVMGVSSIGVIMANLKKDQIRCACLGDVFNLPMSTVTIVEDLLMVGMAVYMLV